MKFNNLEEIFQSFNNLKVLIIGDVMIDSYLWGKVDRISPEAPVPVVQVQKREHRLGGAANVALNIQALGATPILCSVIGKDSDAAAFQQLMDKNHIQGNGIILNEERITTIKHRILSGHQHMLRIDSEIDTPLSSQATELLLDKIKRLLPQCQVVIFEDYDKGVLTEQLINDVIALAAEKGIPTVVDPKKRNFLCYKKADLFKPNLKELREGLKIDLDADNNQDLKNAVKALKDKVSVSSVLLTLSERGVYLDYKGQEVRLPAHKREIADVSGAGDTVISVAAAALALGLKPELIAELSNLAGGLVCEHLGVVPIDKPSLLKEAKESNLVL